MTRPYVGPAEPDEVAGWTLDDLVARVAQLTRAAGGWVRMDHLVRAVYSGEEHDEMSEAHWQVRRACWRLHDPLRYRLGTPYAEHPVLELALDNYQLLTAVRWIDNEGTAGDGETN